MPNEISGVRVVPLSGEPTSYGLNDTVARELTADHAAALEDHAAALAEKADAHGTYESMTVGLAEQLTTDVFETDAAPYTFRTAGGAAEIGNSAKEKIVGGTIVWNQLCNHSASSSTANGITFTNNGDGSWTLTGTCTAAVRKGHSTNMGLTGRADHILCVSLGADIDGSSNTFSVVFTDSGSIKYTRYLKSWALTKLEASRNINTFDIRVYEGFNPGTAGVVLRPQLYDLTEMFGATVAQAIYDSGTGSALFHSLFPNDYYAYNAGELMSVQTSGKKAVGFNAFNPSTSTAEVIRGLSYQVTGTYTRLTLNGATIAPDTDGIFIPEETGTLSVVGGDSTSTCVHLIWDGSRNGEYEAYRSELYPLDGSLTLRGIPKWDSTAGAMYYDGDEYASDGTVTRKYASRAYASGDESLSDAITDGTNTVYALTTPTTESAEPYTSPQWVDNWGMEEFVDAGTGASRVAVPVGHVTDYPIDLKAKLESAPGNPDVDGDYVMRRSGGQNSYVLLQQGVDDMTETVTGSTPEILAESGWRYVCGTVTELTFTPSTSGTCSVRFTCGTAVPVLTLPNTVIMPGWWKGVEANHTYAITITDGVYAEVEVWKNDGSAETYTDATLTTTGVAADAKATGDAIADVTGRVGDLKSAFDEKVNSRYGSEFSPNLITNDASMTMGYVAKNGSISSATDKAYTDYIQVKPGDILRVYYTKSGVFTGKALRFVCCYDQSKTPVSSAGTNTGVSPFTVPEGVAFVRVTVDGVTANVNNYMLSVNCTPTEYTAYTPLKEDIIEDFLTPESETFLAGLMENGISSGSIQNKYGCALPLTAIFQTIGLPEKWYNDSITTPPTTNIIVSAGLQYTSRSNDGTSFLNTTALTSANGYRWSMYDVFYALIKSGTGSAGYGWPRDFIAENLSDCSLLAIGDSTVDHDTLTATLLSHFAEQGHTLTLLGTLGDGSGTNKNEGRSGWSAQDYLTDRQYGGVTNPFYNPTTETFDFAYYMANQGYTGVDFVVVQLGINDLYNYDDTQIVPTWNAVSAIIDSILAYNSGIKVILNLPTTPNSDQSQHTVSEFLYRNRVIRYNEYAMAQALAKYGTTKVRCSYCHLILDSHTEIRDNVHPTAEGYQKMALEVVNQINCWQAGV